MSQKTQKQYLTKKELAYGLMLILIGGVILLGSYQWVNGIDTVQKTSCEEYCYSNATNSCHSTCPTEITFVLWTNILFIMAFILLGVALIFLGLREIFSEKQLK